MLKEGRERATENFMTYLSLSSETEPVFRTLLGMRERSRLWETDEKGKRVTDLYEESDKTLGSGHRETWVRLLVLQLNLNELVSSFIK